MSREIFIVLPLDLGFFTPNFVINIKQVGEMNMRYVCYLEKFCNYMHITKWNRYQINYELRDITIFPLILLRFNYGSSLGLVFTKTISYGNARYARRFNGAC